MDSLFCFSFYDHENCDGEGEPTASSFGFYITNINIPWNELEERLAECTKEFDEKYGVNDSDWFTSLSVVNTIGYTSYELNGAKQNEVIEGWRQAVLRECPGCLVGVVYAVNENMDDVEILEATKAAHERNQAEIMRNTLNNHVDGNVAVGSPRKM